MSDDNLFNEVKALAEKMNATIDEECKKLAIKYNVDFDEVLEMYTDLEKDSF